MPVPDTNPTRGTFFACCASTDEQSARSKVQRVRTVILFFMSSLCLDPLDTRPFYLITLSARASTLGEIVRPICFAVLRLITNSNFFDRSTGRSVSRRRTNTFVPVLLMEVGTLPELRFARSRRFSSRFPLPVGPPAHRISSGNTESAEMRERLSL